MKKVLPVVCLLTIILVCIVVLFFQTDVTNATKNKATITKQPVSVSVDSGEMAVVSFNATGDGLTYKWYYKNKGTGDFAHTSAFSGDTYSVQMNESCDGRQIYCVVSDKYGNSATTDTVTISMQKKGAVTVKPVFATITKQPVSVTVDSGKMAVVSFNATGDGLTYKWYYKNKGTGDFTYTSAFSGDTYSVQMNESCDGRQIYCVVSDKYGNTATTDTVTISMQKKGAVTVKPVFATITKQPVSVTVDSGKMAVVSFNATGDGLTYKWYYKNKGAGDFAHTPAFSGNTYSVQMNESCDGRQIYCVVTDKYGNRATTDTVSISMQKKGAVTVKPVFATITKQPVSVSVDSGEMAVVSFNATGDGLTYKWYYKNKGTGDFAHTPAFSGNTYSVQMNESCDGRQIYCVVSDKYGNSATTDTVTISMQKKGAVTVKPVFATITKQPVSVSVDSGEMAVVSFNATGDGLTYKWYYKNKGTGDFAHTSAFSGDTYSVQMNESCDGRQIYCVVSDKYGNSATTDTVSISMQKKDAVTVQPAFATITKQPVSVSVDSGEMAVVSFNATGDGLTYKWYYKNKGTGDFAHTSAFSGDTYSVQMNESCDGRQIYCVVSDKYGNSATTNTVTISMIYERAGDYLYKVSGGTATIVGYTGSGGAVEIPGSLGGYAVTAIGRLAFYECKNIVSVVIPDSVTTIESGAFQGCEALVTVTISKKISTIGDSAFAGCLNLADVHYADTQSKWDKVSIGQDNQCLKQATLHCKKNSSSSLPLIKPDI